MGLGYDLNVFLHKVAHNSSKYPISLKTMSNCLDLVRLLILKLKKDVPFPSLYATAHLMEQMGNKMNTYLDSGFSNV